MATVKTIGKKKGEKTFEDKSKISDLLSTNLLTNRTIKMALLPSRFERQKMGKKKPDLKSGLKGEHT